MKFLCSILSFFLSSLLLGQNIFIDSKLDDTVGFSRDLAIIEHKIGFLNDSIKKNLVCLEINYRGFDVKGGVDSQSVRKGIIMIHKSVREDMIFIFNELFERNFPIKKIVPVNKYGLNADSSGWNDSESMSDNNTSGFNYRFKTNSKELSPHAFGTAVDINPLFNPYEKQEEDRFIVQPEKGFYNKQIAGTVTDSIVTGLFDKIGWIWGGRWNNPIDYQHFDLRKNRDKKHYLMKDSNLKNIYQFNDSSKTYILFSNTEVQKNKIAELIIDEHRIKQFEKLSKKSGLENIIESWLGNPNKNKSKLKKSILLLADTSAIAQTNSQIVRKLYKDLISKGFSVDTSLPVEHKYKYHSLLLKIDVSTGFADSSYQLIFIPGAFKEKDIKNSTDRLRFFNLMIGDDLKKSENFAIELQKEITEKVSLKALNRLSRFPDFLEKECIKTDNDGIYCRNFQELNRYNCPTVYTNLKIDKISEKVLDDLVKSFSKTVQNYFKIKS